MLAATAALEVQMSVSVCVFVTLATAVLQQTGLLKDFQRTSKGLLKDFGLMKDFGLYGLQNLLVYKSENQVFETF